MIDFDTSIKIPQECDRFGQIKCCQKNLKVGQSPINRQIWSHWLGCQFEQTNNLQVYEESLTLVFVSNR